MEESDDEIEFQGYEDGRFGFAWIGPGEVINFQVAMTFEYADGWLAKFSTALQLAKAASATDGIESHLYETTKT